MLDQAVKAKIRKMIIDGQENELLSYLHELKVSKKLVKADDIALAALEGFGALKSDDWRAAHLSTLNAFGQFAKNELQININLLLYVFDPVILNCLRLCNDSYKGELTKDQAKERLGFIRAVKQNFNHRIAIDSVISEGFRYIDLNFEKILNALINENSRHLAVNNELKSALSNIGTVIFSCHFRNERISADTYDALVLFLNRLHFSHAKSRIYKFHHNPTHDTDSAFKKFLTDSAVSQLNLISLDYRGIMRVSHHLHAGLVSLDEVIECYSLIEESIKKPGITIFQSLVSKLKPQKSHFEDLKQYCEQLEKGTQWLNTDQIYQLMLLLFYIKGMDENLNAACQPLESILNRYKGSENNNNDGPLPLCHLFYRHGQFTHDIFCQVFLNKLKLGDRSSRLWQQINHKFFEDEPMGEAKFSKESIYREVFSDKSTAERVVSLMMRGNHELIKTSADEVIIALWLDRHFKIFNCNLPEIIFNNTHNNPTEDKGYFEKISQFSAYLLLMLHLNFKNNSKDVNPEIMASFLDNNWKVYGKIIFTTINVSQKEVIQRLFSIDSETDFELQLKNLIMLTQLKWQENYNERLKPKWDIEENPNHIINLLSSLNFNQLEKIVKAMKEIPEGFTYDQTLRLNIKLIQKAYPLSAVQHFLSIHYGIKDIAQTEEDFSRRFFSLTDSKNAIMLLLAWNEKMAPKLPFDIIAYIANFLFPANASFTARQLALSLRKRESFLTHLKVSYGLKNGAGACYASIRSNYPVPGDPTSYEASINQLHEAGLFNQENIQKLHAESGENAWCKQFYK